LNEELIKTLYDKSIVLKPGGMGDGSDEMIRWFDHRKFAELVVQECIDVVNDTYFGDPHEVDIALDVIKKHFGLEE
jgi:hypothetical protein